MFEKFLDWLREKKPSPQPGGFKPRLEALECRWNPANKFWLGYTTDFTDPQNWGGSLPTAADDLYFRGPTPDPTDPPEPGAPPPPTLPPGWSNTSTTFVNGWVDLPPPYAPPQHYLPTNYAGIHIIDGYSGTLTMPFDISFGGYRQTSGNTSTPGTNVTVTNTFFWSGGTANSSNTAGEYRIQTPLGIIAPNDKSVDLGSTLRIQQNPLTQVGSALEINPGTVNVKQGDGLLVQDRCLINLNPVPKAPSTEPIEGYVKVSDKRNEPESGLLKVDNGGWAVVKPRKRPANNIGPAVFELEGPKPRVENYGEVHLVDRAELKFVVKDPLNANATGFGGGFVQQHTGDEPTRTKIEAGCAITFSKATYMSINSGTVELAERRDIDGTAYSSQDPITITAAENVGGALRLFEAATLKRADEDPKRPLKLTIKGALLSLICDGTLDLYAVKDEDKNDQIVAENGKVKFSNTTKVKVSWFSNTPAIRPVGQGWTLVHSTYLESADVNAISQAPPPDNFTKPALAQGENVSLELVTDGEHISNNKLKMYSDN